MIHTQLVTTMCASGTSSSRSNVYTPYHACRQYSRPSEKHFKLYLSVRPYCNQMCSLIMYLWIAFAVAVLTLPLLTA